MKLQRMVKYDHGLFALVPLINVLFLLLALVSLSNNFILQPGVSVSRPFSTFALGPQRNPQVASIVLEPQLQIYYQDEKVTLSELDDRLARPGAAERPLIIRADRLVPYETISAVMNAGLQRGCTVVMAASDQRSAPSPVQ